jgi:DNA primase
MCTSTSDPVPGANFDRVLEAAIVVRDALATLEIPAFAKTTGSKGIHIYVPIVRGTGAAGRLGVRQFLAAIPWPSGTRSC